MKWPFVSRARYEYARHVAAARSAETRQAEGQVKMQQHNLAEMRRMYDALLDKYHELASPKIVKPEAVVMDEPEFPPPEVMAAIQAISPTRDRTYEANWQYWETNKARAKAYPKDFADEILRGAMFEPTENVS